MKTQSHSFTTSNGTSCTVWNQYGEYENANGWWVRTECNRTWVQNNTTGQTRNVEPGCAFQGVRAAQQAGW